MLFCFAAASFSAKQLGKRVADGTLATKIFLETNDAVIFLDTRWNSSLVSKNILFALKQRVWSRHFRKNKSEKQSHPSLLSTLSPDQSDREEPLTYWRPSWDTRQLRSRSREIEMQFPLSSFTSVPILQLLVQPASVRAEKQRANTATRNRQRADNCHT